MTLGSLGDALFGEHLLAFEVAGLLLLAAMVGAVALVKRDSVTEPSMTTLTSILGGGLQGYILVALLLFLIGLARCSAGAPSWCSSWAWS